MRLPRPRFTVRWLMLTVALAAVYFAGLRLGPYAMERLWLPLAFLIIASYGLVLVSHPDRINPQSIALLVAGILALALLGLWAKAMYDLGRL